MGRKRGREDSVVQTSTGLEELDSAVMTPQAGLVFSMLLTCHAFGSCSVPSALASAAARVPSARASMAQSKADASGVAPDPRTPGSWP